MADTPVPPSSPQRPASGGVHASYFALLTEALTLGAKKTTKRQFPAFVGMVLYFGLAAILIIGFLGKQDSGTLGMVAALLVASVLVLLVFADRLPAWAATLLILVFVLGTSGGSVYIFIHRQPVAVVEPNVELKGMVRFKDGSPGARLQLGVAGERLESFTNSDGFFEMRVPKSRLKGDSVQLIIVVDGRQQPTTRDTAALTDIVVTETTQAGIPVIAAPPPPAPSPGPPVPVTRRAAVLSTDVLVLERESRQAHYPGLTCRGNPAMPASNQCVAVLRGRGAREILRLEIPNSAAPGSLVAARLALRGLASNTGESPHCLSVTLDDAVVSARKELQMSAMKADGRLIDEPALSTVEIDIPPALRSRLTNGVHYLSIGIPEGCGSGDGFVAFRDARLVLTTKQG